MKKTLMILAGLSVCSASFSQVWVETGDAGELPGTAQVTMGAGALVSITGDNSLGDADMFAIMITDEASFSATTVGVTGFDTQLFLFNSAGMGVTFNDDSAASFQSTLTSTFVTSNGLYYIAISGFDYDAASGGLEIWLDTPFGVERAPDGPGAGGAVDGWLDSGAGGVYEIILTGAEYAAVPEPGTFIAIGIGLAGLALARRRK